MIFWQVQVEEFWIELYFGDFFVATCYLKQKMEGILGVKSVHYGRSVGVKFILQKME